MRYFGSKPRGLTDEDRVALDRLSAIANRYRVEPDASSSAELPLDFPAADPTPENPH